MMWYGELFMSSLVKHIVLVLLGLCVALAVQAHLPLYEPNATHLILAAVSIGSVVLAFVGVSLARHHDFVWIAAPVAIYAAALIALVTRVDQPSGAVFATSAGATGRHGVGGWSHRSRRGRPRGVRGGVP